MVEKFEFWRIQLRDPRFWCLKLTMSFLDIKLSWKFNVSDLTKKFRFWHSGLRGIPLWYPQILSFFIFHQFSVNGSSWILAFLFEKGLFVLVPQICQILYFLRILVCIKNFMRLAWVVKKFEFWWLLLRRTPSLWYPQILSFFIFNFYLSILKTSSV